MPRLEWDGISKRFFETGVDRGVLYLPDGRSVPWNGLTAVDEAADESTQPLYIDGVKYLDQTTFSDYAAAIKAFTYPDEFLECEGVSAIGVGLYAGDQTPKRFNLSYRTRIGNDVDGVDHGYKIHLVYNLTATPDNRSFATVAADPTLADFGWQLTAVPVTYSGFRPTAHIVLDTRFLNRFLVRDIEDILYGTAGTTPRFPPITELAQFASAWNLITITDHGNGTWTAEGPAELITMVSPTEFRIDEVDATYSDAVTYTVSTTTS